jgi:peptide/nickel transport system permease protein
VPDLRTTTRVEADAGPPPTPDPALDDVASDDPRRAAPGVWPWIVGPATMSVGVVAIVAGATLERDTSMVWRVVLVLAGLVAIEQGIARVGRAIWGPGWDVVLWLSIAWLVTIVFGAVLAPLLPLGEASDASRTLTVPIRLRPDIFTDHPLGTNTLGLDLLARVIHGARVSLAVSSVAVLIGIAIGGAVGVTAGYRRGAFDSVVSVLVNSVLAFPPLVLLLALAAVLDRTARNMALILGLLAIPVFVRLARANALSLAEREFVVAAKAMGARPRRIILRHLLPNVMPTLATYGLVLMAILIVAEASLSFLGLGIPQPSPSWGNMIAEGENGIFEANPHIVIVPGVVLFLTVLSFNLVGERLRRRWGSRRVEL